MGGLDLMKASKRLVVASAFISAVVGFGVALTPTISASAGSSKVYIASSASVVEDRINSGDFYTDGDVTAKDGKIRFGGTSGIISKNKAKDLGSYGVKTLLTFSSTLHFSELASDGTFSVGFGLEDFDSSIGSANSIAITVDYRDGLYIGVTEYNKNGRANELYPTLRFGNLLLNTDIEFTAEVGTDGCMNLYVGGTQILKDEKLSVSAAGYIGFESQGENDVTLSDLEIITYKYDVPENIEYTETFDNGYNANVFYSESDAAPISPSGLSVKDGKLVFQNTAGAYITTRYVYSNFDLTFDLSDLYTTAKYDEDGKLVSTISTWFGIAFGCDSYDMSVDETIRQTTWLQIGRITDGMSYATPNDGIHYILWDNHGSFNAKKQQSMANFNLWDEATIQGRTVNVKFSVSDGTISLYYRFDGDTEWGDPYFTYDLGTMKTGYIRIFSWGDTSINEKGLEYNGMGNFSVDNLAIKNTDYETVKKVTSAPEYKSNVREQTPDYNYTTNPDANDLLANKIENGDMNDSLQEDGYGCVSVVDGTQILLPVLLVATFLSERRKKHE